jgi:uncharacterized membrane protein YbhN (UPF0104 family)/tRNA A-37 threonylcarbamoyl transferase component Bud32
VLLLLGAVLTVLLLAPLAPGPTIADEAASAVVGALPMLTGWFWEISFDLLLVWSIALLLAAALPRARRPLLWEQLAGVVLAFVAAGAAGLASGASWPDLIGSLISTSDGATYPAMRLALATAIIVTTSPHLSRPLRHVGRWVVALGGVSGLALGVTGLIGVAGGLAVGVGSAALVHLAFGSPGGRLPLEKVGGALADLHVHATDLRHATLAARGVSLVTARTTDGRPLLVKVYGRDAWDGQLISSVWLSLWYRDTTPSTRLNRLQQVEHEAFATLLAERAGVPVLPVVAAGLATGRDALLVVEADGRPLSDGGDVDDATLHRLWGALRSLHRTGIAHGQLTPDRLVLRPDGTPALADFGAAVVAASDMQLSADRAELLVTTAVLTGADRAVAVAREAVGADGLAAVLPLLQPAAIEPGLRKLVREQDWTVADLRELAATAAGAEIPELEKLRRVSVGSLVQAALIVAVAYVIISAIAGIGWETIVDELRDANVWWTLAALALAPLVQVAQAFSTLGASERPVRYGPVLALQYAIQFLALAVPSSAARVALAVRFFQKAGATTTAAAAVGLIDSLAGFAIQLVIIIAVALTGVVSLTAPSQSDGVSINGTTLAVVGGLLVVGGVVALSIPRVRRFIRSRAADSKVALAVLHSRRNVVMLFGGNLAAQALLAAVLGLSLLAFGEHATFAELLLVNTLVSLFAGLMPVPGGIGVTEAALTAGLAATGVPSAAALSTALVYRVATYYVPPLYGAPAMGWLRKGSYV